MKIQNTPNQATQQATNQAEIYEQNQAKQAAKAAQPSQDTVRVSDEAKLRSLATRTAPEHDGVRSEKVAELKAQLANGTSKPDLPNVAENLISDDLDLVA
jgi:negative regulator of flagellin synthesis FlgM